MFNYIYANGQWLTLLEMKCLTGESALTKWSWRTAFGDYILLKHFCAILSILIEIFFFLKEMIQFLMLDGSIKTITNNIKVFVGLL